MTEAIRIDKEALRKALTKYPEMREILKDHWLKYWLNDPEKVFFPKNSIPSDSAFYAFKDAGILEGNNAWIARLTPLGCKQCAQWAS